MRYRVRISGQADADLRGIFEYIAFTLRSTINAAGQLDRLEKAITSLDTMPERYAVFGKGKWKERGLRRMSVDKYLVFYIPDTQAGTVDIIRVLYGGMDLEQELGKNTQT